jgi:hypothetical protein
VNAVTAENDIDLAQHKHYDRFMEYHEEHPETYEFFVTTAKEAKKRGINRGSIKALIEYGRWEAGQDFSIAGGFSHDFQSLYARLIMQQEADLHDFFEIRRIHALRDNDV